MDSAQSLWLSDRVLNLNAVCWRLPKSFIRETHGYISDYCSKVVAATV